MIRTVTNGHWSGELPKPDPRKKSRQPAPVDNRVVIAADIETDEHGWPTTEAIRKATERSEK